MTKLGMLTFARNGLQFCLLKHDCSLHGGLCPGAEGAGPPCEAMARRDLGHTILRVLSHHPSGHIFKYCSAHTCVTTAALMHGLAPLMSFVFHEHIHTSRL